MISDLLCPLVIKNQHRWFFCSFHLLLVLTYLIVSYLGRVGFLGFFVGVRVGLLPSACAHWLGLFFWPSVIGILLLLLAAVDSSCRSCCLRFFPCSIFMFRACVMVQFCLIFLSLRGLLAVNMIVVQKNISNCNIICFRKLSKWLILTPFPYVFRFDAMRY
jgi:hypothetical protein